jgi:hypothetical protein
VNPRSSDLGLLSRVPDPLVDDAMALPPPPALPPAPPRTRQQHYRGLVTAGAIALLFQIGWVGFCRHPLALASVAPLHWVVSLVPLAGAIGLWRVAAHRGSQGLGPRIAWLASGIVVTSALFVLTAMALAPADRADSTASFIISAVKCVVGTGILCVFSLGPFGLAFRRAFASASTWRSAGLGTACGALATATMSVSCPNGELMHVLLGHGTIIVIGGVAGAMLGRRFTRV